MALMTDDQLRAAVQATPPTIVDGLTPTQVATDVYGCAVYLHIGRIFKPGAKAGSVGSVSSPIVQQHCLNQGETALVMTQENFRLDAEHAAIVFPSSTVSMQGLLMTNPGHVDPGYSGPLHVTVINMSKKQFALVPGAKFLRALVFKLDHPASTPLQLQPGHSPVTQELMDRLASDFMNFEERARKVAKAELRGAQLVQLAIPLAVAVVTAALTGAFGYLTVAHNIEQRVTDLENVQAEHRITTLETQVATEQKISQLKADVQTLRRALATKQASSPLKKTGAP